MRLFKLNMFSLRLFMGRRIDEYLNGDFELEGLVLIRVESVCEIQRNY